jgi:hypothetical protein
MFMQNHAEVATGTSVVSSQLRFNNQLHKITTRFMDTNAIMMTIGGLQLGAPELTYSLFAAVMHIGPSLDGGHYIATVLK